MPPKMIKGPVVGPPGGPIYQMRLDRQELGTGNSPLRPLNKRSSPWFRKSGGVGGITDLYNLAVHEGPPAEPQVGRVAETTGGVNPNHRLVIMANVNDDHPTPNPHLRHMYKRALRCAANLPPNGAGIAPPWRFRPATIAFELIESNPLPWSCEDAADNAVRAITEWFADPVNGAARRLKYATVLLLVPFSRAKDPERIRRAWERAWDRYITIPPIILPPSARNFINLKSRNVPK